MKPDRQRVIVWMPEGRNAALAIALLERHGIPAIECRSAHELAESLDNAGCALLSQEALTADALALIEKELRHQPPWSDFPFIVLTVESELWRAPSTSWLELGNVTILSRPTQSRTLLTAIGSARRARSRQYEAEQAILHRDQFLAMLGHELRNPLAAIALAAQSDEDQADVAPQGGLGRRGREIIARQTRHLTRLVDDLLDVARVTTGKVNLNPVALDINDVLARCAQGAELLARQSSIQLCVEPAPEPLIVCGDFVRLEEVIGNLLSNALKYSAPHSRVDVSARAEGERCLIEVSDNGLGISPEMLPRVFDLFAQAEVALDRAGAGLGIGLTIAKSLVELHGGALRAESSGLGTGSMFTVSLPRLTTPVEPCAPSSRHHPGGPLPVPVLLVDDNADLLEMTKAVLEGFGCDVVTAPDGPSGLEQVSSFKPALAFIDIGLPGIDGYEVAREVCAAHEPRPWLVALTGYGQPEDRERALAAGFDQHLTKPVSVASLRQAIEQARDSRQRRSM